MSCWCRYVIVTRPVRQGRLMLALEEVLAMQLDEEPSADAAGFPVPTLQQQSPSDFTFQPGPAPGLMDPSGCMGFRKAPTDTLISSFPGMDKGVGFCRQHSQGSSSEGSNRKRTGLREHSQDDVGSSNNISSNGSLVVGHSTLRPAQVSFTCLDAPSSGLGSLDSLKLALYLHRYQSHLPRLTLPPRHSLLSAFF